jgi:hypothetical protein
LHDSVEGTGSASVEISVSLDFVGSNLNEIFNHVVVKVLSFDVPVVIQQELPSSKLQIHRSLLSVPPQPWMLARKTLGKLCWRPLATDASRT